jgi:hypothetical protein
LRKVKSLQEVTSTNFYEFYKEHCRLAMIESLPRHVADFFAATRGWFGNG